MKKIEEVETGKIFGGDGVNLTGPVVEAIVSIIDLIKDAGIAVGSGIRRIGENHLCPIRD